MEYTGDEYRLSTGRAIYSNAGLISINHNGDIAQGYDGLIYGEDDLSPEEKAEIASFMIALWTKWGCPDPDKGQLTT